MWKSKETKRTYKFKKIRNIKLRVDNKCGI